MDWLPALLVLLPIGAGLLLWLLPLDRFWAAALALLASLVYAAWAGRERTRAYFGLLLFLTGAIVGCFVAQDLLLFYVFFEAMLIPLYLLVGVWGGRNRVAATIKFV